jgi:hypothetical protein
LWWSEGEVVEEEEVEAEVAAEVEVGAEDEDEAEGDHDPCEQPLHQERSSSRLTLPFDAER